MIMKLLSRIFGTKNERELRKLASTVELINSFEYKMKKKSDKELKDQTNIFKIRFRRGESLEEILPEAFATVKEAAKRTLNMYHYKVQLLGGIGLHMGKITEMRTGEGKTLVATLPTYLNGIEGKGVHIVTVNDYLAERDSIWMGKLYKFLGFSVGTLKHGMSDIGKKNAYNADVTYGTNNEFGFDYLRDNMKFDIKSRVQKDLHYSIVDEVDSILIDEARTPLIISVPAEKPTTLYKKMNELFFQLNYKKDYKIDEKVKSVLLTDSGVSKIEKFLNIKNIYDHSNIEILHHVNQALKANTLFKRNINYIVKNGEVIIVDEFTGRLMPGRRYSEGLHQAIEAKEKVKIENENQTLATITFQNYFRLYKKLAGMTGTANTEAEEFKKIYNLDVLVIPTNRPMIRIDLPDVIYRTRTEKINAIINDIKKLNLKGQPVLVGTTSIDSSEQLSMKLKKIKIEHSVLNAKNHEKEAEIIALAGQRKGVTIATNMAGRGTDIVLGKGTKKLGGLHIIGSERNESRRVDNQLRGRSGRQGDSGSSKFYLSLEDDLLRIFGGKKITSIMKRLGMNDGEPIEHLLITKSIENAQSKVENYNFSIRKHLLEYDDVLNQQREIIYKLRKDLLLKKNLKNTILDIIAEKSIKIAENHKNNLNDLIYNNFNFESDNLRIKKNLKKSKLSKLIYKLTNEYYIKKELEFDKNNLRKIERFIMLQLVDSFWKDHLFNMDHLKEGVSLRSYAQLNPLLIYKKEGFEIFEKMIFNIRSEFIKVIFNLKFSDYKTIDFFKVKEKKSNLKTTLSDNLNNKKDKLVLNKKSKIGRNSLCPCGSKIKYKKCCGQ